VPHITAPNDSQCLPLSTSFEIYYKQVTKEMTVKSVTFSEIYIKLLSLF